MACHEVAALRLGLMNTLGIEDEAERQHELAELGDGASEPGPLRSLTESDRLSDLRRYYEASLADLSRRVASTAPDDPKLPYLRSLVILTKKVELELAGIVDSVERFHRELEEMHDFVHEIYPAG